MAVVALMGVAAGCVAAVLAATCLRLRSFTAFVLAVSLIGAGGLVVLVLGLSLVRAVTGAGLAVGVAALTVATVVMWVRAGRPRPPSTAGIRESLDAALRDPVLAILTPVVAAAFAYLGVVAVATTQPDMDAMLYHLPRAALWRQQQAVAYVPGAIDERINAMPPNAEIGSLATMLASGGDRYVGLVQLTSLAVLCIAVGGIARRLGLGARESLFGAVLFATFPVVVLQAPTALTDLAVAAPLACAAFFGLGRTRRELSLAGVALALALGTKLTAVLALPVLAVFLLSAQPRQRWPALGVSGLAGLVAGSYWYALNVIETGSADGGLAEAFAQSPAHGISATAGRAWDLLVDLTDLPGTTLRHAPLLDRVLSPLVVAGLLLAAAVVWRRGRRVEALSVAVATVPLAFAGPLLERWDRVPRWTWQRLGELAGGADVGAFDMPEGFDSMSSWYGPALLAVVAGAVPLTVAGVRRGRIRPAALVALAAPLVFLAVVSLVVVYDPLRGRFFAFPVALATAAAGVSLRARPLAWAAGALALVGMSVSLLSFNAVWHDARWEAQAAKQRSAADDPGVFRFLATRLPADATLAIAARRDTYVYPLWDAGLRRRVRFVTADGTAPARTDVVVVGPNADVPQCAASWSRLLESDSGWRVYERGTAVPCEG